MANYKPVSILPRRFVNHYHYLMKEKFIPFWVIAGVVAALSRNAQKTTVTKPVPTAQQLAWQKMDFISCSFRAKHIY